MTEKSLGILLAKLSNIVFIEEISSTLSKTEYKSLKNGLMKKKYKRKKMVLYIGCYCQFVEENYEDAKNYYLMAIEKGDSDAMSNLGLYYHFVEKNNKETEKYYLMAVEKGNMN